MPVSHRRKPAAQGAREYEDREIDLEHTGTDREHLVGDRRQSRPENGPKVPTCIEVLYACEALGIHSWDVFEEKAGYRNPHHRADSVTENATQHGCDGRNACKTKRSTAGSEAKRDEERIRRDGEDGRLHESEDGQRLEAVGRVRPMQKSIIPYIDLEKFK